MNTHTFPCLVGKVLRKLPNGLYNLQIWHAFIPSQGINHLLEPWADTGWILERHFAANSKAARVWSLPVSSVEKQSALQAPLCSGLCHSWAHLTATAGCYCP